MANCDRSKALAGQKMTKLELGDPSVLLGVFQGLLSERNSFGIPKGNKAVFLDCNTGSLVWFRAASSLYEKVLDAGAVKGEGVGVGESVSFVWKSGKGFEVKRIIGGSFSVKKT